MDSAGANVRILTLDQSDEWYYIINSFANTDIYFTPGYCKAFYLNGDGVPMLFYIDDANGKVAYIFLKRDVCQDKKLSKLIPAGKYYDICSVYGYGGPLYEAADIKKLQNSFNQAFTAFCNEHSIISDFTRFHCILGNHELMKGIYDIETIRTTVFIDLSKGEQYIWDDFDCNCRNNIRKAQRSGITIKYGRDQEFVEKFLKLYISTMLRNNADSYYYFSENFFLSAIDLLKENSLIFAAYLNDTTVASCIVIYSKDYAHIHFAASDSTFSQLRPNNILFHEIALWACRQGKKTLHIGGGVTNNGEDTLYQFKKCFSKTNRLPYFVGMKVYNDDAYCELVRARSENDNHCDADSKYFPKYRKQNKQKASCIASYSN